MFLDSGAGPAFCVSWVLGSLIPGPTKSASVLFLVLLMFYFSSDYGSEILALSAMAARSSICLFTSVTFASCILSGVYY